VLGLEAQVNEAVPVPSGVLRAIQRIHAHPGMDKYSTVEVVPLRLKVIIYPYGTRRLIRLRNSSTCVLGLCTPHIEHFTKVLAQHFKIYLYFRQKRGHRGREDRCDHCQRYLPASLSSRGSARLSYPLIFCFLIAYAFSWLLWMPLVLSEDGTGLLPFSSPLLAERS
jgi:hypothetical protein